MMWLLFLTLPCLGGSVPLTSDPGPGTELVAVMGGHDASKGAWPWHVGLWFWNETEMYWGLICGGSLVDLQWVLTAGHCIPEKNPKPQHFKVQLGGVRPPWLDIVMVASIIRHPEYRIEEGIPQADVALLKLESSMRPTNLIKWISLPPASYAFPAGTRCWVTGWGKIGPEEQLPESYNLQEVEVPIVPNEICRQQYLSINKVVKEDMLCAGSPGRGACKGDSGGPLVCKWNHTWVQVGVVSWAYKCGLPDFPGVYSRVTSFLPWICRYIPSTP